MFTGFWFHLSIIPHLGRQLPSLCRFREALRPNDLGTLVLTWVRIIVSYVHYIYICAYIHAYYLFINIQKSLHMCIYKYIQYIISVCVFVYVCVCHAIRIDKWKINGSRVTPNRGYYCSSSVLWFYTSSVCLAVDMSNSLCRGHTPTVDAYGNSHFSRLILQVISCYCFKSCEIPSCPS